MLTRKILSNHLNINQGREQKPMQVCTASLQKHLLSFFEQKNKKIKTNWRQIIPILIRRSSCLGNIDLPLKNWVFFWKIWSTGPKDTWRGMECISLKDASATSWSMIVQKKKKRSNHWSRKEKLPCSGTQQIHFFAPGDSNFPRGKFYASTDWLSLYPPLSRFKPVQAFKIGRLA